MRDLEEERRELRARAQRHRGGHDEAERKHDDAQADQDAACSVLNTTGSFRFIPIFCKRFRTALLNPQW